MSEFSEPASADRRGGFSGLQVAGIVVVAIISTAAATIWIARGYLFPGQFEPVELSSAEQRTLDAKLERFETITLPASTTRPSPRSPARSDARSDQEWLDSGAYDESGAGRDVELSERELNALLARDPEIARRAAIDLSDDLASARILVPLDPDLPIFGGRTLRVSAGVELAFADGRPSVVLRGVSLMGVPIPNAWLGNLKNVDLVERYGADAGVWRAFAAGIEHIEVRDGRLHVRLRE
jgi:hypothetical protein